MDGSPIRCLGEIDNTPEATRKLVAMLSKRYGKLNFCHGAGPTGYGLHRWLTELGQDNIVVAPSLIPKRAGDLTAVWVPDEAHQAMRDLVRARNAAVRDHIQNRTSNLGRPAAPGASRTTSADWGTALALQMWICSEKESAHPPAHFSAGENAGK